MGGRKTTVIGESEEKQDDQKKPEAEEKKVVHKISRGGKRSERKKPRHGKKYREVAKAVDKTKAYPVKEAVEMVKKTSPVKFDASVEIHVNTGVDTAKSEQVVRGTVTLPHGSVVKSKRIAVIAEEGKLNEATEAGADVAGSDDLIEKIEKGFTDFEILVSTPAMMPKLGKLGKVLGPKGLMPNPKIGTVTNDIKKAIGELKAGKAEFRMDAQGIVHGRVGKVSMEDAEILENIKVFISALNKVKPDAIKGVYIKSLSLASAMGPGVKVDTKTLSS